MVKQIAYAVIAAGTLIATSSPGWAQLQERPAVPREWYSEVILWNYGEDRPPRQAEGCLRWGTHTRTWYDICRNAPRRATVSVRY